MKYSSIWRECTAMVIARWKVKKLMYGVTAFACLIPLMLLSAIAQESGISNADGRPLVTIKELMEKTITPATNTLWDAYDPPKDEEQWKTLEEAAVTLLAAANVLAIGGTGPMDNEWVKDPAWKASNQIMINAGYDALKAIRARDHVALLAASDVLYPPCERCHQQFNPGVVNAQ